MTNSILRQYACVPASTKIELFVAYIFEHTIKAMEVTHFKEPSVYHNLSMVAPASAPPSAPSAPSASAPSAPSTIMPTISRSELLSIIRNNRGHAYATITSDTVPLDHDISVTCARGHTFKTPVACIREWCAICLLMNQLCKRDRSIVCATNSYEWGQKTFVFKCAIGHRFVSDLKRCKEGCRVCNLITKSTERGSDITIYPTTLTSTTSRIRCHCEKIIHNPQCSNTECAEIISGKITSNRDFALGCKNFIACGSDFYITEDLMKFNTSALDCKAAHWWEYKQHFEVLSTVRIFEVLFDQPFDDVVDRVEFTGYNKNLRVAFTHRGDNLPNKCIVAAAKHCNDKDIRFIIIPMNIVDSIKIAQFISNEVSTLGIFNDNPTHMCRVIRTITRKCNIDGKIFPKTIHDHMTTSPYMHGLRFCTAGTTQDPVPTPDTADQSA